MRGRLTNWDRSRGWLWWPERRNDALTSRPIRNLQSVLPAISKNNLQARKSLEIKVTGADETFARSSYAGRRPPVRPAAIHLAGAGTGGGKGMGRMLATRHPAAVFTSV